MSKSIAVISGKGGAGKSFFCINIAAALVKLGFPTVIIDTDSGMRNADILLHKSDSLVFDLSDLAAGNCSLDDALTLVNKSGTFSLIAGAKDADFIPDSDFLSSVAKQLSGRFAFILFDAPAGAGAIVRNVIKAADCITLVTNPPKESAIPAAAVSETAFRLCPNKQISIVLNKVNPKGIAKNEMSPDEIMDACVAKFLGLIYATDEVEKSKNKGQLLSLGSSLEATQLRNIARRICGENVPLLI